VKCAGKAASGRFALQPGGIPLPAFTTLPIDPLTGAIGKRPSGALLYHQKSHFGPPEPRKLDRNLVAKILFLAEALDRRTRGPRQHGGVTEGVTESQRSRRAPCAPEALLQPSLRHMLTTGPSHRHATRQKIGPENVKARLTEN